MNKVINYTVDLDKAVQIGSENITVAFTSGVSATLVVCLKVGVESNKLEEVIVGATTPTRTTLTDAAGTNVRTFTGLTPGSYISVAKVSGTGEAGLVCDILSGK